MVVGGAVADIRQAIAARVGLTGDEPLPAIFAALDQRLAEATYTGPPTGSELIDSTTLARLRDDAERGRTIDRNTVIRDAILTGRMRPADRPKWERLLDADSSTAAGMIRALPVTVPVAPIGTSHDPEEHDEAADLIRTLYGGT